MNPIIKTYQVKIVREPGDEPITGQFYEYAEEELEDDATSKLNAFKISQLVCSIPFRGQIRRTFIDGLVRWFSLAAH